MGTCNVSKQEIIQKLEELLNDLEGEVYISDFREACNEVADNYKHFSDIEYINTHEGFFDYGGPDENPI